MFDTIKQKYQSLPKQIKASLWFLICSFLQKGISTITTPIFTRLLDTSEYGSFNVFNSWLGILTVIITLDLSAGVYTQGLVKYDNEKDVFSSSLQGLTIVLIIAWTVVYLLFGNFFNELLHLTTVQMSAMLVMMWATAVFKFWAAEQRVLLNYRTLVFVTLVVSFLKPFVGILFVIYSNDKVTARILGLALVELICYMPFFFIQVRKGKIIFSRKFWLYALSFNLPLVPHYLSQTLLNSADRIMINYMIGSSEAGMYSLAYAISNIMLMFNTAMLQTLNPWIYQKIKDHKENDIAHVGYAALAIIAALNIVLIAFAPEVIAIFAPPKYRDAIWVVPPVAMSGFFIFCYTLFAAFEFYFKKTKFIMFASLVAAILNIVLNYIFIGLFGYYAAGYTTLFCYTIYAIGHYIFMNKVCELYLDGSKVFNLKIIIGMSILLFAFGFLIQATYTLPAVRYSFCAICVFSGIIFRKQIKGYIGQIVNIRKTSKI